MEVVAVVEVEEDVAIGAMETVCCCNTVPYFKTGATTILIVSVLLPSYVLFFKKGKMVAVTTSSYVLEFMNEIEVDPVGDSGFFQAQLPQATGVVVAAEYHCKLKNGEQENFMFAPEPFVIAQLNNIESPEKILVLVEVKDVEMGLWASDAMVRLSVVALIPLYTPGDMAGKRVTSSGTSKGAGLLKRMLIEPLPGKSVGNIVRPQGSIPVPNEEDVAVTNSLQAIFRFTPSRYFEVQ